MKFFQIRIVAAFLFIFCISSCCTVKNLASTEISPVYITNTKKFYLLPTQSIEKNVEKQLLLTASFGDNQFIIHSYLKADDNEIFLSIFNDFGTDMGSVYYNNQKVNFNSHVFPKALKGEYILADLQFSYYKSEDIKNSLQSLGLDFFTATLEDGTEIRLIKNNEKVIEEISKTQNKIVIKNFLRGYSYTLLEGGE